MAVEQLPEIHPLGAVRTADGLNVFATMDTSDINVARTALQPIIDQYHPDKAGILIDRGDYIEEHDAETRTSESSGKTFSYSKWNAPYEATGDRERRQHSATKGALEELRDTKQLPRWQELLLAHNLLSSLASANSIDIVKSAELKKLTEVLTDAFGVDGFGQVSRVFSEVCPAK